MTTLQKQIIYLLQKEGKMSRKKLGNLLGVTPAAMSQNIKYMIDNDFVISDEEVDLKKVGRKEVLLRLNKNKYFFLGIELSPKIFVVRSNLLGECETPTYLNNLRDLEKYLEGEDFSECLSISLSKKGFYSEFNLEDEEKILLSQLREHCHDVYFNNNIACLAYAYKYYHDEEKNFVLIKYGPGLGSALFIADQLLKNEKYPTYELGKLTVDFEGHILEDLISYSSLGIDDNNVLEDFENNPNKKELVLSHLAFSIRTLNTLLQLDSIIVTGEIFQNENNKDSLASTLKGMGNFDIKKLTYIDDYKSFNKNKSVISGQYLFLKK